MKKPVLIGLFLFGLLALSWHFLTLRLPTTHSLPNTNQVYLTPPIPPPPDPFIAKYVEKLRQALEEKNTPIDFYGEVADQDGRALSGVKINASIRHWGFSGRAESQVIRLERTTDARGRFDLHGPTGDAFDLDSLQKDGYELEPDSKRDFGVAAGSLNNPVVFKMWSTNLHEPLVTGEKSFPITPDGRDYFIDLMQGAIVESGQGDLKISVKRPDRIIYGQRYDWACEMSAINGGLLQQETNPYSSLFAAPTNGYKGLFQFEQKTDGGWGDSTGPKRFYVRLHNRPAYGRITIELYAYYNDQIPGLIRLQYALNPSGAIILR